MSLLSTNSGGGRVVVGIDGSPQSAKALAWAIEEARLRQAGLDVIYAFPAMVSILGTTAHEYLPQVESEAKTRFEEALANAPAMDDLDVKKTLIAGNPSQVLVEASQGATLLVVAAKGRGSFGDMLLGSVSTHAVHQAHCPVVVVRPTD
jgi:nucleotide-binding universal stress UspA family protein